MKILITGITGRIGSLLARQLSAAGHEIRGLVWPGDPGLDRLHDVSFESIEGSLVDQAAVERAVRGVQGIHHLGAAFQAGGPFTDEDYFEINVRGTFNMLEAARHHAENLDHFFFASTDALYRKYVPGGLTSPIHEDETPIAPVGAYALTKQLGEDLCRGYHRTFGVPITIFRFSLTVAGTEILHWPQFYLSHWQDVFQHRPADVAQRFQQQLPAIPPGEERLLLARDETGRSYKKHIADARDIAHGLTVAVGKPGIAGETFQLAGPRPFTWEEVIPYLAQKLGLGYVDIQLPDPVPTFYEFDLTKSKQRLGFQPQYDLFRMIDEAISVQEQSQRSRA